MNNKLRVVLYLGCAWALSGCEVFDDDDDDKNKTQKTTSSSSSMTSSSMSSMSSSSVAKVFMSVRGGEFALTDAGSALYDNFSGEANLTVSDQDSIVEVSVWGLNASQSYGAHVHNELCSSGGGGGHYLQDLDGDDVAGNGLWPTLSVDADGNARTVIVQKFTVRDDARSVVIHEPGSNDRIACADLVDSVALGGDLALTAAGNDLYSDVSGSVYLSVVDESWSKAEVSVTGLNADETYGAHVHLGDCASDGGAHYVQDVSGMDLAENGLWPIVTTDAWGNGSGWASNAFAVRTDETKSVVLHQPESGARIACGDLSMPLLAFRSGGFSATADGVALYGDSAISGRASLKITSEGSTEARIKISGLKADTEYHAHVHNKNCESGGGGHYLQLVVGDDVASNGLFPYFTTNQNGYGMGMVEQSFVARADARSVVVHEPVTGARIACADLR